MWKEDIRVKYFTEPKATRPKVTRPGLSKYSVLTLISLF